MATPTSCVEEYDLPQAEALLAGTLALMTGYVQACCDNHREAMGRKVVGNLQLLAQAQGLTPHFRTMLWSLQERWAQQCTAMGGGLDAQAALSAAERQRALWVAAPDLVQ